MRAGALFTEALLIMLGKMLAHNRYSTNIRKNDPNFPGSCPISLAGLLQDSLLLPVNLK